MVQVNLFLWLFLFQLSDIFIFILFFFFIFFFTFFFLAFTTIPIQPFFCYVGGVLSKGSCVRSGLHVEQQCVLKYL